MFGRTEPVECDIRREGKLKAERVKLVPRKVEFHRGMLYWTEEERLTMLALLLENVGADTVVRTGRPDVWREAVEALPKQGHV